MRAKSTSDETHIEKEFDKAFNEPMLCEDCRFHKMYVNTRNMFVRRQYYYIETLERIAHIVNPENGMCGVAYSELPEMIEEWINNRGNKAKMNIEIKRLREENARLALEAFRGR